MSSTLEPPGPAPSDRSIPVRRPELGDWFNRHLFHPLARTLALALASTRVTPNQLSVSGGLLVVFAGVCYTLWGGFAGAMAGFVLHLAWHVVDGADGDLARLTGKAGPLGEAVDGISDYFSHIALYCMIGAMLMQSYGPAIWLLVVGAGVSRIFQASHYEERRREYEYWVYGRSWIRNDRIQPDSPGHRLLVALVNFYLSVGDRTRDRDNAIEALHQQAEAGRLSRENFRDCVRRNLRPLLKPMGTLGANQRTLVLGGAMLLGRPVWYFVYEAVLLNLVLLWSIGAHTRAARSIASELSIDKAP